MAFTLCSHVRGIHLCRARCAHCHIYKEHLECCLLSLDQASFFLTRMNLKLHYLKYYNVALCLNRVSTDSINNLTMHRFNLYLE